MPARVLLLLFLSFSLSLSFLISLVCPRRLSSPSPSSSIAAVPLYRDSPSHKSVLSFSLALFFLSIMCLPTRLSLFRGPTGYIFPQRHLFLPFLYPSSFFFFSTFRFLFPSGRRTRLSFSTLAHVSVSSSSLTMTTTVSCRCACMMVKSFFLEVDLSVNLTLQPYPGIFPTKP